jgi:GNAT superfamily N-acetyltransferase
MSSPLDISLVEKLAAHHQVRDFKCGKNLLDLFIRRYALVNQRTDASQTYVVHRSSVVMGYYTLVFSSIKLEAAPVSIQTEMPPNYPVPVMLFARFAVDKKLQGQGVGTSLLKDAFLRTTQASEIGGLAAILVDAIDDKMVTFYKNYGFSDCPAAERKLMIAIKDVRAHLLGAVTPK